MSGSLFDVIHAKVHSHPGGSKVIALRMRTMGHDKITEETLNKKVNPACNTHHLRVDEMLSIQAIVDTDDFVREICCLRSLLCISRVVPDEISDECLLKLLLERGEKMGKSDQELLNFIDNPRKNLRNFKAFKKSWLETSEVREMLLQCANVIYAQNGGKQ